MADSIDERPSPEDRALISEVLMRDWDPIRIINIPGSRMGEYDWYINGVYAMIVGKPASQEEIATYLQDVQNQRMGLRVTDNARERCRHAAQSLVALRVRLEHSGLPMSLQNDNETE
jgi:hypothetical protein